MIRARDREARAGLGLETTRRLQAGGCALSPGLVPSVRQSALKLPPCVPGTVVVVNFFVEVSDQALRPAGRPEPCLRFDTPCVRVPDHELVRRIGIGAFGEVWLARNAVGTFRAVKIVQRDAFEAEANYEREFRGLQKFEPLSRSHEGLVDILHLGRDEEAGHFFYVMELADDANAERQDQNAESRTARESFEFSGSSPQPGNVVRPRSSELKAEDFKPNTYVPHTLREDLKRGGSLPLADCLSISAKLCAALGCLHSQGLVHRDIKPSNIIFVSGEPKLADIGLVAAMDDAQSLVGTAGYIPPEGPGTVQADLFSLGKVLYEMALGKDRQEFPQLPPDLSSRADYAGLLELNEIILKACETDQDQRYRSAKEMADDLEWLRRGRSVRHARATGRAWRTARNAAAALAVIALLVAALLLVNQARRGHVPDPEAAQLYEEGRWHYSQLTPAHHAKALEKLTQALQRDPKFTRPYGELMALYTWNQLPGVTNEHIRLQRVQEIAQRALAADPDSAEGYTALSWSRFLQRDWRGAEADIQRALRLNPELALAHDVYAFYLSMQGRGKEARREGQLSANQPPLSRRASAVIAAWPFMAERRFDLAIAGLQRVLDLDPEFAIGYSYLGDCHDASSNYVAAIEAYRKSAQLLGADSARIEAVFGSLRRAYDAGGREGYYRQWIELLTAELDLPESERWLGWTCLNLAGCYARMGESEKALDLLEAHFDEPQEWHQIKFVPGYDSLHGETRFKALVKRAGLEP